MRHSTTREAAPECFPQRRDPRSRTRRRGNLCQSHAYAERAVRACATRDLEQAGRRAAGRDMPARGMPAKRGRVAGQEVPDTLEVQRARILGAGSPSWATPPCGGVDGGGAGHSEKTTSCTTSRCMGDPQCVFVRAFAGCSSS